MRLPRPPQATEPRAQSHVRPAGARGWQGLPLLHLLSLLQVRRVHGSHEQARQKCGQHVRGHVPLGACLNMCLQASVSSINQVRSICLVCRFFSVRWPGGNLSRPCGSLQAGFPVSGSDLCWSYQSPVCAGVCTCGRLSSCICFTQMVLFVHCLAGIGGGPVAHAPHLKGHVVCAATCGGCIYCRHFVL